MHAQFMNPDLTIGYTEEMYNQALIEIENKLSSMGGSDLSTYGLPQTH